MKGQMKVKCQVCGIEDNIVSVNCGDIFLGYLCTQHNIEYIKILTKMQEQYFQDSIEAFKDFVLESSTKELERKHPPVRSR